MGTIGSTHIKILHVTKKYPDALGGDAVVVSNLQGYQEAAGHRVVIFTSNCREIKDGRHIYKFGLSDTPAALDNITARRLVSLANLFFKAFAVIGRERPDVIHTHSIDMAFFVSFAARFFRVPIVHTFHIVTFYDQDQSLLRRKAELLLAKSAGLKEITAPNLYDVARLHSAGLVRSSVLYNGVDVGFWQAESQACLQLPAEKNRKRRPRSIIKPPSFVCISVGRLESQKGYEYLIRAVALLKSTTVQPFRLVIVGEGKQKKALQELTHLLEVEDNVAFVGRKSREEIRLLLSAADVAVFASLYETTPITLLEAWAVGLPVISTPVGILRASPPGLACYVRPKDERSLAKAIQICMENQSVVAKMTAAGKKEVKKYAWPGIARTAEALYRSVL